MEIATKENASRRPIDGRFKRTLLLGSMLTDRPARIPQGNSVWVEQNNKTQSPADRRRVSDRNVGSQELPNRDEHNRSAGDWMLSFGAGNSLYNFGGRRQFGSGDVVSEGQAGVEIGHFAGGLPRVRNSSQNGFHFDDFHTAARCLPVSWPAIALIGVATPKIGLHIWSSGNWLSSC